MVVFGTSGHRGSSLDGAFNDAHIAATTQAIVEYRTCQGIDGPLFIGKDTHALSMPAWTTAIEVLCANDVEVIAEHDDEWTPTPAVSRAIIVHNRLSEGRQADGIVVTLTQPATRWRIQIQPTARWPGRYGRHRLDC